MSLALVRETRRGKSRNLVRTASRWAPARHRVSIDGNHAVAMQISSSCVCDGGCPLCSGNNAIQAKLKIGQPDDRYEQEADRIADQVMRMSEPTVHRKPG